MKAYRILLIGSILISFPFVAYALDIPLTGVSKSGGGGSIGYVDMERIFQIYPETKHAKEDYSKRLAKKREELAQREESLNEVRDRLSILEATLQDQSSPAASDGVLTSTDSTTSPLAPPLIDEQGPQSVLALKKELENKILDFEEARKLAAEDLRAFENKQSQMILGKIYRALKDLAIEEQVSIVVDKSSILFGSASIDLTDKLQLKVRGY